MSKSIERCFQCNEPTGRAGAGEDSIYSYCDDSAWGPFCTGCFEIHKAGCVTCTVEDEPR